MNASNAKGSNANRLLRAGVSGLQGAPLHHLLSTDSTMERAAECLRAGDPHGTVVVSEYQSAGRGRGANRRWTAPPGSSLLFTVLLRAAFMPGLRDAPGGIATLPLIAGLSAAEALDAAYGVAIRLKWPNDLYLHDRKLGGILCRYRDEAFLVGIGVNCNQRRFPDEIAQRAIALRAVLGEPVPRYALLARILRALHHYTGSLGPPHGEVLAAINRRLFLRRQTVTFRDPDGTLRRGSPERVDPDGALVLLDERGGCIRRLSGEIVLQG